MSKPKQNKIKNYSFKILVIRKKHLLHNFRNKIVVELFIHENGHHILWTSYFYVSKDNCIYIPVYICTVQIFKVTLCNVIAVIERYPNLCNTSLSCEKNTKTVATSVAQSTPVK